MIAFLIRQPGVEGLRAIEIRLLAEPAQAAHLKQVLVVDHILTPLIAVIDIKDDAVGGQMVGDELPIGFGEFQQLQAHMVHFLHQKTIVDGIVMVDRHQIGVGCEDGVDEAGPVLVVACHIVGGGASSEAEEEVSGQECRAHQRRQIGDAAVGRSDQDSGVANAAFHLVVNAQRLARQALAGDSRRQSGIQANIPHRIGHQFAFERIGQMRGEVGQFRLGRCGALGRAPGIC